MKNAMYRAQVHNKLSRSVNSPYSSPGKNSAILAKLEWWDVIILHWECNSPFSVTQSGKPWFLRSKTLIFGVRAWTSVVMGWWEGETLRTVVDSRTSFLWCESRGILACISIDKSPHYIVGVSDGAKMDSIWEEGVYMGKAAWALSSPGTCIRKYQEWAGDTSEDPVIMLLSALDRSML